MKKIIFATAIAALIPLSGFGASCIPGKSTITLDFSSSVFPVTAANMYSVSTSWPANFEAPNFPALNNKQIVLKASSTSGVVGTFECSVPFAVMAQFNEGVGAFGQVAITPTSLPFDSNNNYTIKMGLKKCQNNGNKTLSSSDTNVTVNAIAPVNAC
jgi:hypothetical protein